MIGNTILINARCVTHGIVEPYKMTMTCDNESALWKSFDEQLLTQNNASCDLFFAIRHQIQNLSGVYANGPRDTRMIKIQCSMSG